MIEYFDEIAFAYRPMRICEYVLCRIFVTIKRTNSILMVPSSIKVQK